MKTEVKSKLDSIFRYPFFQSVGKPLPPSITKLGNWPAAAKMCRSHKWDNCKLMAKNALARFTEQASWERGQEWNPLAEELQPIVLSFVDTLLLNIPVSKKGHKNIREALSWDIVAICLEHEYRDVVEPFFYIPLLDPWYAAGHFPCGWDGDEFPEGWDGKDLFGQLMVF
jgi:hypothetical protein